MYTQISEMPGNTHYIVFSSNKGLFMGTYIPMECYVLVMMENFSLYRPFLCVIVFIFGLSNTFQNSTSLRHLKMCTGEISHSLKKKTCTHNSTLIHLEIL